MADKKPTAPPEGERIRSARKFAGLSIREAARRAGLSEGRWRQIESGYQSVATGVYIPSPGPADTVARMARVVDLTPEQLEEAERPDAAEELRKLNEFRAVSKSRPDELDEKLERMKANPKTRRQLEKFVEILEDCN